MACWFVHLFIYLFICFFTFWFDYLFIHLFIQLVSSRHPPKHAKFILTLTNSQKINTLAICEHLVVYFFPFANVRLSIFLKSAAATVVKFSPLVVRVGRPRVRREGAPVSFLSAPLPPTCSAQFSASLAASRLATRLRAI